MSIPHSFRLGIVTAVSTALLLGCASALAHGHRFDPAAMFPTTTPIKHVVVIFQENASFDHYFGTYPHALNPAGEPRFHARTDNYGVISPDANGIGTVIKDPDPTYDDCSSRKYPTVSFVDGKRNIGDLLDAKSITWRWFEGSFRPSSRNADGTAVCGSTTRNVGGVAITDYIPHHEPFQYYASTSNPHHLAPSSVSEIGHDGQANHQYDLEDFWAAMDNGGMPAVSFLKVKSAQDGHAGYSDPLDEQQFLVSTINRLEQSSEWNSTVVIISYDDSGGWYDHVMGPIVSQSNDAANDALIATGLCGTNSSDAYPDRCGYGPRLPLMVISPYAKSNFVDHSVTDQSSILRFIEDYWQTGRIGDDSFDAKAGSLRHMLNFQEYTRPLFLDPASGLPVQSHTDSHGHGNRD